MTNYMAYLGIGSALLNVVSLVIYVRSILRGKTKPERASWWIWLCLMVVSLAAQKASGATWSLLLTASYLLVNATVATLSLRYGYGRFSKRDVVSVFLMVFGVVLWAVTGSPLAALILVVVAGLVGNWLTWIKTWRAPYSENLTAWTLTALGSIAGALSVGSLGLSKLIFPAYAVFTNSLLVYIIIIRRHWRSQRIKLGEELTRKIT